MLKRCVKRILSIDHVAVLGFYLLLGFNFSFPQVAMQFWMIEEIKWQPAQTAAIYGLIGIPWCFKPFYGFLSDRYPIGGLRRKPYLIIGALMTFISWLVLPFLQTTFLRILALFTASLGACVGDVMMDSIVVCIAKTETEESKGTIQSNMWISRNVGSLLGVIGGSLYYNAFGSLGTFLANACVPLFWIVMIKGFDEPPTEKINTKEICVKIGSTVKQPQIYKAIIFMLLACSTPAYGQSFVYYLEKELKFTPMEFGYLKTSRRIFAIISIWCYKRYFRHVELRKILFWSLLSVFIVEQSRFLIIFHLTPFIPNFALALLEGLMMTIVGEFILMPLVVLSARICPEGIEGTFYAFIISIQNLSGIIGDEWGSLVVHAFGVTADNFTHLWKVMVLCHLCDIIPLMVIQFVPRDRELEEEEIPLKHEIEIPLDEVEDPSDDEVKTNI